MCIHMKHVTLDLDGHKAEGAEEGMWSWHLIYSHLMLMLLLLKLMAQHVVSKIIYLGSCVINIPDGHT